MATNKSIGGFRIIDTLGRGGMGVVYRAMQLSMGREVALKVLDEQIAKDPRLSERFLREARIAARVNHAHVVTVYDGGRDGDLLYLAMELVPGGDADRLRVAEGGKLPPRRALEVVRDGARGLAALHAVGLLHRDIKPANLFIAADGAAKLADLGLSREVDGGDHLTSATEIIGTPAYMSPEQARGEALDIRSDIYALGATLYALIAGQAPYQGSSAMAIAIQAASGPFPDAKKVPGMPAAMAALIKTATAADPAKRFADPKELVVACDRILGHVTTERAVRAKSPAKTPRAAETAKPGRLPIGALIAGGVALAVAIAVVWWAASAGSSVKVGPAPGPDVAVPTTPAATAPITATAATAVAPVAVAGDASAPESTAGVPAAGIVLTTEVPSWSSAHGQDRCGSWADLTVGNATQRMRWIPPGTFIMGSPPDELHHGEDEVQHRVTLTHGFWMDDCVCTEGWWKAVTGSDSPEATGMPMRPIQGVSHDPTVDFCATMSARVPGMHARLPTEAEWEYACRAGTTTVPSERELKAMAWVGVLADLPFPAKGKAPNPWGLYDMYGNINQGCQDWYGPYPPGDATDPTGPATGTSRATRGGCWFTPWDQARPAGRTAMQSDGHWRFLGFRFVIDAKP